MRGNDKKRNREGDMAFCSMQKAEMVQKSIYLPPLLQVEHLEQKKPHRRNVRSHSPVDSILTMVRSGSKREGESNVRIKALSPSLFVCTRNQSICRQDGRYLLSEVTVGGTRTNAKDAKDPGCAGVGGQRRIRHRTLLGHSFFRQSRPGLGRY
ncbi:Hypothetical protein NTJ_11257 [Nesidiocoris tenuis]|uniref:Uncharacterized protein n=1 Tax=Nesidiocoris tenuis TaxID=355587 RepID=A0ABN7B1Z2_9HEMI|nr:Hypothetical protein NTJ_11257 [Nesidiocoris tenuis]